MTTLVLPQLPPEAVAVKVTVLWSGLALIEAVHAVAARALRSSSSGTSPAKRPVSRLPGPTAGGWVRTSLRFTGSPPLGVERRFRDARVPHQPPTFAGPFSRRVFS